ncbi:hypothetical protein CC85DRAFT_327999 [Cutaneotrichosporon oleaginosum]|uniref:Uncharacterized protein n=1 Tax=Cutaneotrichosporon oleaginosum TaxID=879819 RepID=A0A0J0XNS0_9TREE|nr:uncharacterized protein CC85DRAFT_327999 [Cutaneotrichosporon oleaginosum]KLT42775.1 hypothetical protein CC85DRAFT_327999 [Cutaneotrichosporon oleaginosum]TXT09507.1 hypothetical protein COLE_03441 [Cutaneotrichosporon oleaginosum]
MPPSAKRDYQARMAHTVLMYLYMLLFMGSLVVSNLLGIFKAPWTPYRASMSHISPQAADAASYANSVMDGITLVYWFIFFVCQHTRRALHVWVQLLAYAAICAANLGLGVTLERAAFEPWFRAAAVLAWVKAGLAVVFAINVATYTGVVHGKPGFRREFAPAWRDGVPRRPPAARGAQIAQIVLLSLLLAYTFAVFVLQCILVDVMREVRRQRNTALLYVLLAAQAAFCVYLAFYLFLRRADPFSRFVSVLADTAVLALWAALIAALAGASVAVVVAGIDGGTLQAILAFVCAGLTLAIVAFEVIYTAVRGGQGRWHRRFATPPEVDEVEFEMTRTPKPSRETSPRKEGEGPPTLSYV